MTIQTSSDRSLSVAALSLSVAPPSPALLARLPHSPRDGVAHAAEVKGINAWVVIIRDDRW